MLVFSFLFLIFNTIINTRRTNGMDRTQKLKSRILTILQVLKFFKKWINKNRKFNTLSSYKSREQIGAPAVLLVMFSILRPFINDSRPIDAFNGMAVVGADR